MLIDFKFSNFASFKDEAVFSTEPITSNGKIKNSISTGIKKVANIYRTSAIFGANASGKSNLVSSLLFLKNLVFRSYMNSVDTKLSLNNYKLDGKFNKPSLFEIRFLNNHCIYRYKVMLDSIRILEESLYVSDFKETGREKTIYERKALGDKLLSFIYKFSSPYGIDHKLSDETIHTRLFLSELVNNKNSQDRHILSAYLWFMTNLNFIIGDNITTNSIETYNLMLNGSWKELTNFMIKADTGISGLKDKEDNKGNGKLISIHKNEQGKDVEFDFYQMESKGTQQLLLLSGKVINSLQRGTILVIDELDSSLHPHLVKYIVDMFNNPEINKYNAQLIFTSHAHYLMDGETLTRDQIWLVSKDNSFYSELYPLSDFSKELKRRDEAFYNQYKNGIFGAVPQILED